MPQISPWYDVNSEEREDLLMGPGVAPEFGTTTVGPDGEPMVYVPEETLASVSTTAPKAPAPKNILPGQLNQTPVTPQQLNIDEQKSYEHLLQKNMLEQESGIQDLENKIRQYQKASPEYDNRPLMNLAEMFASGQGYAQMGRAPSESPAQREAKILALQEGLQQRREAMTKQNLDSLREKINAGKALKDNSLQDEKTRAQIDWYRTGNKQSLQDQRLDFGAHNTVVKQVKNDKILGQRLVQISNLDNAVAAFRSGTATSQQFNELQQAVRANLGIKGSSGVSERAETYLKSIPQEAAALRQWITGKPEDIQNYISPKMVSHVLELVEAEKRNIAAQKDTRLKAIVSGYDSIYKRNPELKTDLDAAVKAASDQFGKSAPQYEDGSIVNWQGKNFRLQGDTWVEVGK